MKVKFEVQKFNKEEGTATWLLTGPRLSFPTLWDFGEYKGVKSTRHAASFLIPLAEKETCKKIQSEYIKIANAVNSKIKKLKDTGDYPRLKVDKENGFYIVKSSNSAKSPATYFDHRNKPIADPLGAGADVTLYPGCHVRAKLTLNFNKDSMWVNLAAIQFLEDGERFGGGGLSGEELAEGFEEVEGDFEKHDADGFDDDTLEDDDLNEDDLELEDDDDDLELDD